MSAAAYLGRSPHSVRDDFVIRGGTILLVRRPVRFEIRGLVEPDGRALVETLLEDEAAIMVEGPRGHSSPEAWSAAGAKHPES